jgi:DNA-binding transcriptional LysR family regulator
MQIDATREQARWDDLQLLLVLCRQGSLKAAAAQLVVNISTVARRLDAFEERLGQHLFDRTTDGTRPTAAAEQLLPFAESMERAALGASHALDGFEAEPEGSVRITAPPGVVDHFLAGAIAELVDRHPGLRIEVLSTVGYADLTRREADIALRVLRPASGDLVATKVGTSGSTVLVAPALAKRIGRLADLEAVRWITYGEELGHLPEVTWITEQVPADRIVMRCSSLTAQVQAVRSGLGATVGSIPFSELDGLAALPLAPKAKKRLRPFPEGSLWLVGHRALRDVPRIAATWTFLLERMRSLLPSPSRLRQ